MSKRGENIYKRNVELYICATHLPRVVWKLVLKQKVLAKYWDIPA